MAELGQILASGDIPMIRGGIVQALPMIQADRNFGATLSIAEIEEALGGTPIVARAFLLKDTGGRAWLVIYDGTEYWNERLTKAS